MLSMLHIENNPYLSAYIHATNHHVSLQDKEFESLDSMFNYDLDRMQTAMASGFHIIPEFATLDELHYWLETT